MHLFFNLSTSGKPSHTLLPSFAPSLTSSLLSDCSFIQRLCYPVPLRTSFRTSEMMDRVILIASFKLGVNVCDTSLTWFAAVMLSVSSFLLCISCGDH